MPDAAIRILEKIVVAQVLAFDHSPPVHERHDRNKVALFGGLLKPMQHGALIRISDRKSAHELVFEILQTGSGGNIENRCQDLHAPGSVLFLKLTQLLREMLAMGTSGIQKRDQDDLAFETAQEGNRAIRHMEAKLEGRPRRLLPGRGRYREQERQ